MKIPNLITPFVSLIFAAAASASAPTFTAYTSVAPVAKVMEEVGAGYWTTAPLVGKGKNPHTFSPTPQEAAAFSKAAVYLAVRIEIDEAVKARAPQSMRYVEVEVPEAAGEEADDPHLWLDPDGLVLIARASREAFSSVDPAHKADYATACAQFERKVGEASDEAKAILSPYKNRKFYVQHDAFTRFAKACGLVQISVEEHEKEPTAQRLVEVLRLMRGDGTKVIYAQPGHNPAPLEALAGPIGAKIEILDAVPEDPVADLAERAKILAKDFASNEVNGK
jgi:ABC-type Zn uptake system ZnuABC Zn-binding protein ZnuA